MTKFDACTLVKNQLPMVWAIRSKFDYYILTSQILIIAMLFLPTTVTQEWMNGVKQTVKLETVRLMFVHVTHEKYGS